MKWDLLTVHEKVCILVVHLGKDSVVKKAVKKAVMLVLLKDMLMVAWTDFV